MERDERPLLCSIQYSSEYVLQHCLTRVPSIRPLNVMQETPVTWRAVIGLVDYLKRPSSQPKHMVRRIGDCRRCGNDLESAIFTSLAARSPACREEAPHQVCNIAPKHGFIYVGFI